MKTLILSLLILLAFTGCDILNDSSNIAGPTHKSVDIDGIEYSLDIPKNNFSLYDTLSIVFTVKNNSTNSKVFNFSNIQQLAFQLIDKNQNVAMFYPSIVSPALSSFTVNPGESKLLNQKSLFINHSGNYINRGFYILNVTLADRNSPRLELNISIK